MHKKWKRTILSGIYYGRIEYGHKNKLWTQSKFFFPICQDKFSSKHMVFLIYSDFPIIPNCNKTEYLIFKASLQHWLVEWDSVLIEVKRQLFLIKRDDSITLVWLVLVSSLLIKFMAYLSEWYCYILTIVLHVYDNQYLWCTKLLFYPLF